MIDLLHDFLAPLGTLPDYVLPATAVVMALGGFVKGAVGFAMPMVALSGLGLFLTAQEAVAVILIPSALSNLWQTFRQGWEPAKETFLRFWRLNFAMALMLGIGAQFVPWIDSATLFILVGAVVTLAALVQLAGWRPQVHPDARNPKLEAGIGIFAGSVGGITGVWGPPVLLYLMARGTEKQRQIRMLGINFTIGWWVMTAAHGASGVLNAVTLPLSALMLVPVLAGMALGIRLQDRMDADLFRRITLVVLVLAGLNLLRRGFF